MRESRLSKSSWLANRVSPWHKLSFWWRRWWWPWWWQWWWWGWWWQLITMVMMTMAIISDLVNPAVRPHLLFGIWMSMMTMIMMLMTIVMMMTMTMHHTKFWVIRQSVFCSTTSLTSRASLPHLCKYHYAKNSTKTEEFLVQIFPKIVKISLKSVFCSTTSFTSRASLPLLCRDNFAQKNQQKNEEICANVC